MLKSNSTQQHSNHQRTLIHAALNSFKRMMLKPSHGLMMLTITTS